MTRTQPAHAPRNESDPTSQPSPPKQSEGERRHRVLAQNVPSVARDISRATVIKNGNLFLLTEHDGSIPFDEHHGLGLYFHDCRYLSGYELRLDGAPPVELASLAERGFMTQLQCTNPDLRVNGHMISKEQVGIRWTRILDGDDCVLLDELEFENYGMESVELPVQLRFRGGFEDVFQIRGLLPKHPGHCRRPAWNQESLQLRYDGADGLQRAMAIHFSEPPSRKEETGAEFRIRIEPGATHRMQVAIRVIERPEEPGSKLREVPELDFRKLEPRLERDAQKWMRSMTQVQTPRQSLAHVVNRQLRDLRMLQSRLEGEDYFAGGLPWFGTLFGRDSLITSLEMLAYRPGIAAQTLRLLAKYQGKRHDTWKDEDPGKILHELRVGELAHLGEIPQSPYYGSVDATPLFLLLVAKHASWTGDLSLLLELREPVERALRWVDEYGDLDGDGYIEYRSRSGRGLVNQGWKDSGDAIVARDGSIAKPPIALVEVQGYVYAAKRGLAGLLRRTGEGDRADRLDREADALRERFNRDFWMEERGSYALALDGDKKPLEVISSNAGHALWCGIADPDKAVRTAQRLMAPDMFSGWGVRTLSSEERRFNPIGYHLGTVWPHDNAILAAGFRRYRQEREALAIANGIMDAATHFPGGRLPELFAGYDRGTLGVPVHYPVACHPQAWAAGSVPYLLQMLLGLTPDAFGGRLRVASPILPDSLSEMEVRGLKVGRATLDLRFGRDSDGTISVEKVGGTNGIDILLDADTAFEGGGFGS